MLAAAACCVVLPLLATGCGGESDDSAERAEQISQSATDEHNEDVRRDLDRMREEQEQQAAAETVTAPQVAGSEEIDQPQDGAVDGTETTEVADSSATGALFSAADRKSFNKLAASTLGREGVAVATIRGTRLQSLGSLKSGVAWSTAKVSVAMAAIAAATGNEADLRRANTTVRRQPHDCAVAASALRLHGVRPDRLAAYRPGAVRRRHVLYRSGPQGARPHGPGDRRPALGPRAGRHFATLQGRLGTRCHTRLGPGLARASDGHHHCRRPVVVAIATDGPGHEADTVALTRIAKWVASHVDAKAVPRQPSC